MKSGPYNFGFPDRPDWVEHFPYQDGLLVSYWDTSFSDNNTSEHPGNGEVLPIDANPRPVYRLDGKPWRPRIQGYDAPFSLQKSDSFTLHAQETGQASYIRGQAAVPVFDDRRSYWDPAIPTAGVKVPERGRADPGPAPGGHVDADPDQLDGELSVGGRPNASNSVASKVVISVIRPSRALSTSSLKAR